MQGDIHSGVISKVRGFSLSGQTTLVKPVPELAGGRALWARRLGHGPLALIVYRLFKQPQRSRSIPLALSSASLSSPSRRGGERLHTLRVCTGSDTVYIDTPAVYVCMCVCLHTVFRFTDFRSSPSSKRILNTKGILNAQA